jgi:hypothetical protein
MSPCCDGSQPTSSRVSALEARASSARARRASLLRKSCVSATSFRPSKSPGRSPGGSALGAHERPARLGQGRPKLSARSDAELREHFA